MRILISGGTGFIGSALTRALASCGHHVTVLTRGFKNHPKDDGHITFLKCDPLIPGPWQKTISGHNIIINLAGLSIFRRWSPKNKREIIRSRILITKNLVDGLAGPHSREVRFFSASGVGYYGYRKEGLFDENSPPGREFLSRMAQDWEATACKAKELGTQVIICRFGQVLGKEGGALPKLTMIANLGMGGTWGTGQQWTSWIHIKDLVNIFIFLLEHTSVTGNVNFTSPNPVRNYEMMSLIRKYLHKKAIIPNIPSFLLKLITGEFSST
ncbi:MAG: TIGR01777 family oxidoreductase, partial [Dehalococcoidia bacterium]